MGVKVCSSQDVMKTKGLVSNKVRREVMAAIQVHPLLGMYRGYHPLCIKPGLCVKVVPSLTNTSNYTGGVVGAKSAT